MGQVRRYRDELGGRRKQGSRVHRASGRASACLRSLCRAEEQLARCSTAAGLIGALLESIDDGILLESCAVALRRKDGVLVVVGARGGAFVAGHPLEARSIPAGEAGAIAARAPGGRQLTPDEDGFLRSLGAIAAPWLDRARRAYTALAPVLGWSERLALADALPQKMWSALPDGRIDFVNQRWAEYAGISREAALADPSWDGAVHPEDRLVARRSWERSRVDGSAWEAEVRLLRHDGSYRWHLAQAMPVRDGDGRIERWMGTAVDIDDRKRAEEFQQQLVAIVGHDLRNPLTAVLLGAETLARNAENSQPARRIAQRVASSAQRMSSIVRDLLDFSAARVGQGPTITPRRTDLRLVCRRVVDELEASWPGRDLVVEHRGPCWGVWDSDRLEQLLGNLVSNALKYGDGDEPVRILSTGDAVEARIAVHNHGRPIPDELVPVLFEPYRRGTAAGGRSLGLGLFIASCISRAHGGSIDVTSHADDGTTFTVRLPRVCR